MQSFLQTKMKFLRDFATTPEKLSECLTESPTTYASIIDAVYIWVQTKKSEDWMLALLSSPFLTEWSDPNERFSSHVHSMYLTAAMNGYELCVSKMSSWPSLALPPKPSCDLSFTLNHTNLSLTNPLLRTALSHPSFVGMSERPGVSILDPTLKKVMKDARSTFQASHWSLALFWCIHVRRVLRRLHTTHTLRVGLPQLDMTKQPPLSEILYRIPDITPNAIRMFGWALSDHEAAWTITRHASGELYDRLRVWYQYLLKVSHEQPDAHRILHKLMRNTCSQTSKWVLGSLGILQTSGGGHKRLVLSCLHRVLRSPVQFDVRKLQRTLRNILNMNEQPASIVRKCLHIWWLRVGDVQDLLNTASIESIACVSPNHALFEDICNKLPNDTFHTYAIAYMNRREHDYSFVEQCVMRTDTMMNRATTLYDRAYVVVGKFLTNAIHNNREKKRLQLHLLTSVRPILHTFIIRAVYVWRKMKKTPCIVCWDVKPTTIPLHGDLRHVLCGDCRKHLATNQCPMCRTTLREPNRHNALFRESRFSVNTEEDDAYLYSEEEYNYGW